MTCDGSPVPTLAQSRVRVKGSNALKHTQTHYGQKEEHVGSIGGSC